MLLHMIRNPGEHLERDETKIAIIRFILSNNKESNDPGIRETKIREYLEERYGMTDEGNIRKHLKELIEAKDKPLLEKFQLKKPVKRNFWDVTKIKHLKNIMEKYPEIHLNMYKKSKAIFLKKFNFPVGSTRAKKAFVQLSLSASFFGKCLDTEIETLYFRNSKLYSHEDFNVNQQIDGLIQLVYSECMKRIRKISYTWPVADEEYIKDAANLAVYQNFPQHSPNSVISKEKFERMLKEIKVSWEEKDHNKRIQIIVKGLSMKISREILSKRLKERPEDTLQNQELLNTISDEIFEKLMRRFPEDLLANADLPAKIYFTVLNQYRYTSIIFERLFKYFYEHDVMEGKDTEIELEFVSKIKEINSTETEDAEEISARIEKLDHLYNEYYEKCQGKSHFF